MELKKGIILLEYTKKNSSTFDIVIKNIGIALNGGVGVTVRVNTDKSNIQELNDLKSLFDSLHYTDNSNFFYGFCNVEEL